MKIIAHIHTFNDDDVIDESIDVLMNQSLPLDEIVLVDNASTDATLDRTFPDKVHVIRHKENLGTNGSIITGMKYAMERGHDLVWLFDADSAPEKGALEKLVGVYGNFTQEERDKTSFLACRVVDHPTGEEHPAFIFTPKSGRPAQRDPNRSYFKCDVAIWSGCLYPLKTVQDVGLPSSHYVLDWGEIEYGFRTKNAGLQGYVVEDAVMYHNIGGVPGLQENQIKVGPFAFTLYELPPIRCYYKIKNQLYFWLHENPNRGIKKIVGVFYRSALFTLNFLVRPKNHGPQIKACFRGFWYGLIGNLEKRY